MATIDSQRDERTLRLLLIGFTGATLAFIPSWMRILLGTWPAWVLSIHAVALAAIGWRISRGRRPSNLELGRLCAFAVVLPTLFLIAMRSSSGPAYYVHDAVPGVEACMRLALQGKNPYAESFEGTPLADVPFFGGRNPALDHVVYYPGSFLASLPVYLFLTRLVGWYDHRLFLLLAHGLALWACWNLAGDRWRGHLLVAAGLNPAYNFYLVQGVNDAPVVALLLVAMLALWQDRLLVSALLGGLAASYKQTAWFFAVLWFGEAANRLGARKAIGAGLVLVSVLALVTLPYVFWDPAAFYDDTVAYLAGTAKVSYPAAGVSLASLLAAAGLAPDNPGKLFSALQLGLVLPLLVWLLWRQYKAPGLANLAYRHSLIVTASFLCARYFNASHLAYVSLFFMASWFLPAEPPSNRRELG